MEAPAPRSRKFTHAATFFAAVGLLFCSAIGVALFEKLLGSYNARSWMGGFMFMAPAALCNVVALLLVIGADRKRVPLTLISLSFALYLAAVLVLD